MGKQWKQILYFGGGSKITADSDLSHENKRCLLLGRNVMTNLDSLLKSRDITLSTKVHLVKGMVFPVVMCGCESWTIEKAEHWIIDCFWTVMLEKTLESPLDCTEIKPVSPNRNQPWIFTESTAAKAETPILWPPDAKSQLIGKDSDAGEDWGQKEKGAAEQRMKWLDSITNTMDMNLSKLRETVKDREAWCATDHGVAKCWTT